MSTTSGQGTGPVAVITGASSGIGEATARALAAAGYRLARSATGPSPSRPTSPTATRSSRPPTGSRPSSAGPTS